MSTPSARPPITTYIDKLEATRQALARSNYILSDQQQALLDKVLQLLRESDASLASRSSQQRGRRMRVRNFLRDCVRRLGHEPAFLCGITLSITALGEIQHRLRQPLSTWWSTLEKPEELRKVAGALHQYLPGKGSEVNRLLRVNS